jgi:hypothetical protein
VSRESMKLGFKDNKNRQLSGMPKEQNLEKKYNHLTSLLIKSKRKIKKKRVNSMIISTKKVLKSQD